MHGHAVRNTILIYICTVYCIYHGYTIDVIHHLRFIIILPIIHRCIVMSCNSSHVICHMIEYLPLWHGLLCDTPPLHRYAI